MCTLFSGKRDKAEKVFNSDLEHFNQIIGQITDLEIQAKAIKVKEKILALYEGGEKPEILIRHLQRTTQLLVTPPGPKRDELACEYQKEAHVLSNNTGLLLQTLGGAMMILGFTIMAAGVAMAFTGVGLLTAGATFAGGAGLLAAGTGIFHHATKRDVVTLSEDLIFHPAQP